VTDAQVRGPGTVGALEGGPLTRGPVGAFGGAGALTVPLRSSTPGSLMSFVGNWGWMG
jgi:hypothetical protein